MSLLYYFIYSIFSGFSQKPKEDWDLIKGHQGVRSITAIITMMYVSVICIYTGFANLFNDPDIRGGTAFFLIGGSLILTALYFINVDKCIKMTDYYDSKTGDRKKLKRDIGLILVILPFVLLLLFPSLKSNGIPLPLIKPYHN